MFSSDAFAVSRATRLDSTTLRASSSWRVIELNDSVSTPSSSRLVTGGRAEKSPRATACVARARLASGDDSRAERIAASDTATNSAISSASVSVTM